MQVEISFVVQPEAAPRIGADRRFRKVFDVEWPGRPMPGETIEVDIGAPISEHDFKVKGVYWMAQGPINVYLEPVVIPPGEVEWQDGLDGYIEYATGRGWEVSY